MIYLFYFLFLQIEGYLQGEIESGIGLEFLVDQWPCFTNIFLRTNSNYVCFFIDLSMITSVY